MGVLDDAIREHLELKRRHGASDEEITRAEQDALGPARRDLIEPADGEAALVPDETGHVPHGDPIANQEHVAPTEDAVEPGAAAGGQEVGAPEPVAAAPTEHLPLDDHADDAAAALDGPTFRPVEEAALAEEPIVEGEAEALAAAVDTGPQVPMKPEPAAYEEPTAPQEPAPHLEEHAHEDPHALHPEEPHRQGDPLVEEEHHVEEHELEEAEHRFEEETGEHHPEAEPPAPPAEEERNERDDLLEDTPDFLQETPEHDRLWFEQRPPREFDFDE